MKGQPSIGFSKCGGHLGHEVKLTTSWQAANHILMAW